MINSILDNYIKDVCNEFDQISDERKKFLTPLVKFISQKNETKEICNLILVCTHNSRRSHLSQVWAQVAARHFGHTNVFAYSGGTEATALFPSAAQALSKAGLEVTSLSENSNPVYSIKYDLNEPAIIGFSKKYNDGFNPQSEFAAIMTCNHADTNCPVIPNATRISLPFEDPKAYDGTELQEAKYSERCRDIAREMLYAFSLIS